MRPWDQSWEEIYRTQGYRGRYPNEDLIRFVAPLFREETVEARKNIKMLEVGCGPGAEIWYLAREGFQVYGIDGSKTAIAMCRQRLKAEGLGAEIVVGDITDLPYPDEYFQVVVDVAAIQHNPPDSIAQIISEVYRVLKDGGHFFSLARSDRDYLFGCGRKIAENTYTDIPSGDASGTGVMHFFTIPELEGILKGRFRELSIEYTERTINSMSYAIAHYIVTAQK